MRAECTTQPDEPTRVPAPRHRATHRLTTTVLVALVAVLGAAQISAAAPWVAEERALPSAPKGSTFVPVAPIRVLDTRKTIGGHPAKFAAAETFALKVTGNGVPADATAIDINVTSTGASETSHLRIFPTGQALPTVSAINFDANETIANEFHVKIGTDGKVSLFNNSGTTHVVVDVVGYYKAATLADLTANTFTRTFSASGKTIAAGECRSFGFVNDEPSLQQGDLVMIRSVNPLADDLVIPTQTVTTFFAAAGGQPPGNAVVVMVCNPGSTTANFSGTLAFEFRVIR